MKCLQRHMDQCEQDFRLEQAGMLELMQLDATIKELVSRIIALEKIVSKVI